MTSEYQTMKPEEIYQTPAYQTPDPTQVTPAPDSGVTHDEFYQQYNPSYTNAPSQPSNYDGDVAGYTASGGFDASDWVDALGYESKDAFKSATGYDSVQDYVEAQRYGSISDYSDLRDRQTSLIGESYSPIYGELDRQLGNLPGMEAESNQYIGELTDLQRQSSQGTRAEGLATLEKEKSSGLRTISEDLRQSMQAAGQYVGGMGAGSSSATGEVSEYLARQGQKSKSGFLGDITKAVSKIQSLYSQEINKIQQFKVESLFGIKQKFQEQMNQLSMAKAQAQGQEKSDIAQMELTLTQSLMSRLQQLDDTIMGYGMEIESWARDRTAQLQDYERQSSATAGQDFDTEMYLNLQDRGVSEEDARRAAAGEWYGTQAMDYTPQEKDTAYKTLTSPITGQLIGQYDPANPLQSQQYGSNYDPNNPYGLGQQ